MDRRHFIKTSFGLAGGLAFSGMLSSCDRESKSKSAKWQGFRYAMCNESMQSQTWAEQCQIVSQAGYTGIEIAPFTFVKESIMELTPEKRGEIVNTMEDNGLVCAGLHWLLAPPPPGLHFTTPDTVTRNKTVDYLSHLIDFCGDLRGPIMVFGSPKQRKTEGISIAEAKNYFVDGLMRVADHAQNRNVKILVETLDRSQTDVINTLAEAIEIVHQIQHPAIQTMFDFHNTPDETEPFDVLVKQYFNYIHHVHVQEMDGKHLGMGDSSSEFVKTFQTLKDLQYDKWISLEVFDFSPGGKVIAEDSMAVLRRIESQLT